MREEAAPREPPAASLMVDSPAKCTEATRQTLLEAAGLHRARAHLGRAARRLLSYALLTPRAFGCTATCRSGETVAPKGGDLSDDPRADPRPPFWSCCSGSGSRGSAGPHAVLPHSSAGRDEGE